MHGTWQDLFYLFFFSPKERCRCNVGDYVRWEAETGEDLALLGSGGVIGSWNRVRGCLMGRFRGGAWRGGAVELGVQICRYKAQKSYVGTFRPDLGCIGWLELCQDGLIDDITFGGEGVDCECEDGFHWRCWGDVFVGVNIRDSSSVTDG